MAVERPSAAAAAQLLHLSVFNDPLPTC